MRSLEEKFIAVCDEYLSSRSGYDIRGEQGLFSFAMIIWLGIQQRLSGYSLRSSLNELASRAVSNGGISFLVGRTNQKIRTATISTNNGGLARARERISVEDVRELFQVATERMASPTSAKEERENIYVLDGAVVTIARSASNLEYFCPTGNGMGELHYPKVRVISAHDVSSGIAREVVVGSWKDSEVALSQNVAKRLPRGSLLIMDRGFERTQFLSAVITEGVNVLLRLKDSHGAKLLGNEALRDGIAERHVEWVSTKSGEALTLKGRVIRFISQFKGFRSSEFYFFTTDMNRSAQEVVELYQKRVQVEVFIRDIKQTLKMAFVRSKKGETIEKELLIAYLTFNLLRATMQETATALGLPPNRMSFTATISLVRAYAPLLAAAKTKKDQDNILQRFQTNMLQSKLPVRSKQRSYPRVIKYPRDKYPSAGIVQKSQEGER
jgi:hypothetical protein